MAQGDVVTKRLSVLIGGVSLALLIAGPSMAVEVRQDAWRFRLDLIGAVQGAYFRENEDGVRVDDVDGVIDFTARANASYTFSNGWVAGVRVEYDSDFDEESDVGGGTRFEMVRDEVFGYLSTRWALLEIGEQDGPADTLSFRAPTLGLGQIRGNFSRYAGASALLTPFDTQDSPKLVVTTAPWRGLRFGASYGTDFRQNANDPDPRRRSIQRDPVELAAQAQRAVGGVVLGASFAFVTADSDPTTEREDIRSWSAGAEARWNQWRLGGAFVERGDSNGRLGRNETEINYGLAWDNRKWGVAASGALIDRSDRDRRLYAIGAYYRPWSRIFVRADFVHTDEDFDSGRRRDSSVFLSEIEVRF